MKRNVNYSPGHVWEFIFDFIAFLRTLWNTTIIFLMAVAFIFSDIFFSTIGVSLLLEKGVKVSFVYIHQDWASISLSIVFSGMLVVGWNILENLQASKFGFTKVIDPKLVTLIIIFLVLLLTFVLFLDGFFDILPVGYLMGISDGKTLPPKDQQTIGYWALVSAVCIVTMLGEVFLVYLLADKALIVTKSVENQFKSKHDPNLTKSNQHLTKPDQRSYKNTANRKYGGRR